jgi:SAM-dependent methyltransferase
MYAEPRVVTDLARCWFYHKTELPGFGEIAGDWDLRQCTDAYLGNYAFAGKRVLDVGAASGFLSFQMEKRGAEVVSFDLDDGANWNVVPHFKIVDKLPEIRAAQSQTLESIKNGYWLSHRAVGSKAKAVYGDIYNMPDMGQFDAVYFGMIIGHLRDPFSALAQGAARCAETMIVTSMFEVNKMKLYPTASTYSNNHIKSWWHMTTGMCKQMLGVLGFDTVDLVISNPAVNAVGFTQNRPQCQTIVARRMY